MDVGHLRRRVCNLAGGSLKPPMGVDTDTPLSKCVSNIGKLKAVSDTAQANVLDTLSLLDTLEVACVSVWEQREGKKKEKNRRGRGRRINRRKWKEDK